MDFDSSVYGTVRTELTRKSRCICGADPAALGAIQCGIRRNIGNGDIDHESEWKRGAYCFRLYACSDFDERCNMDRDRTTRRGDAAICNPNRAVLRGMPYQS